MAANFYNVKGFCKITNNAVFVNGRIQHEVPQIPFAQFAEETYKHFKISYPKFYKMDNLSKLGFLTTELLFENLQLKANHKPDRIGIIVSNKSSSLDTDIKYYNMVKKGVASPAVFVYTLPNILIGEICIRHNIKGENTFFVSEEYDIPSNVNYVNGLFESGMMDACICGWIELMNEEYESFLYLVEKEKVKNLLEHSASNIEKIYNQKPSVYAGVNARSEKTDC